MQCVRSDTIATIDQLRSILEIFPQPLIAPELLKLTSRLQLSPSQWREHLTFDPQRFCFRTIYNSPPVLATAETTL